MVYTTEFRKFLNDKFSCFSEYEYESRVQDKVNPQTIVYQKIDFFAVEKKLNQISRWIELIMHTLGIMRYANYNSIV